MNGRCGRCRGEHNCANYAALEPPSTLWTWVAFLALVGAPVLAIIVVRAIVAWG